MYHKREQNILRERIKNKSVKLLNINQTKIDISEITYAILSGLISNDQLEKLEDKQINSITYSGLQYLYQKLTTEKKWNNLSKERKDLFYDIIRYSQIEHKLVYYHG